MSNEISCPLCGEKRHVVHRHFAVKDLSTLWKRGFGFDPFFNKHIGDKITKLQCVECQLVYYSPLFLGDADFYSILSKNSWYYEEVKWEFNEALNIILENKPRSLLEIGCGNGNFLRKVNHAMDRVEGLEINEKAIEHCKLNNLKVSSKSLDQIDDQFDAVAMFEVLEHLDNLHSVINHIIRITKKGGIIIIAVPNPDSYLKEIDTVLLDMPPHHTAGWCINTFDFIAKKYNLEKIHYGQEPLRDVHYQGASGTKFNIVPKPISESSSIRGRLINPIRKFLSGILLNAQQPLLQRMDYLTFKLEKDKIIGQTHLVVFKKL